ncbi:MAG: endonuclease/exonuclease/phosphatase family protein [Chloroflexi bacterium]|nr:endonuclease/exonuclease/phosphatase family protein [Chloroflexota bacterium]
MGPLIVCSWIYLLALVGYVFWVRLDLERPWWLQALAPFALWVFGLGLGLPLLAALVGSGLLRGVPLLLGTALYWAHFVARPRPRRPAQEEDDPVLRVMTANLLDKNRRHAEIIATIRHECPDLIALQELNPAQVRALTQALTDEYPYQWFLPGPETPVPGRSEGMGLMSRYPFQPLGVVQVDPLANPAQVIALDVQGRFLDVLHMHPRIPLPRFRRVLGIAWPYGLDDSERERDVRALSHCAEQLGAEAIILGDMNATDQCREYRLLTKGWRDVYRQVGRGLGLTYPVDADFFGLRCPWPLFRIDYVLIRGHLYAMEAHVGRLPGSDHRYVVADLSWPCR